MIWFIICLIDPLLSLLSCSRASERLTHHIPHMIQILRLLVLLSTQDKLHSMEDRIPGCSRMSFLIPQNHLKMLVKMLFWCMLLVVNLHHLLLAAPSENLRHASSLSCFPCRPLSPAELCQSIFSCDQALSVIASELWPSFLLAHPLTVLHLDLLVRGASQGYCPDAWAYWTSPLTILFFVCSNIFLLVQ